MSVSLIDDGELWGLIACHHYSGPHRPSYEIRAAAEFLGQTLSLRLVETARRESRATAHPVPVHPGHPRRGGEGREPARGGVAHRGAHRSVLDLVPAGGAAVSLEGIDSSVGSSRPRTRCGRWWPGPGPTGTRCGRWPRCPTSCRRSARSPSARAARWCCRSPTTSTSSGVRPELIQTVSWGGDPHTAGDRGARATTAGSTPASPSPSGRSTCAGAARRGPGTTSSWPATLRRTLLDTLYDRSRRLASTADVLQRSLLPDQLPDVPRLDDGGRLPASAGGQVGGDWYDAVRMPDGQGRLRAGRRRRARRRRRRLDGTAAQRPARLRGRGGQPRAAPAATRPADRPAAPGRLRDRAS